MAAIFDFVYFQTWGIILISLIGLPDLENMGIAVGISLLSGIEIELRLISFYQPPSWISDFWFYPTVFLMVLLRSLPRKHRDRHRTCVSITSDSRVTRGW